MAEIRISKLAKEFNIGLSTVIEFLQKNGVSVEEGNPNAKVEVPDDVRGKLVSEFGSEQKAKQEAEKTVIKYKEIIENAGRKKEAAEEEEGPSEVVIKQNILGGEPKEAPKATSMATFQTGGPESG